MDLDPLTADHPDRTAREDEEAAAVAGAASLGEEPVLLVRACERERRKARAGGGGGGARSGPECPIPPVLPPLLLQWTPASRATMKDGVLRPRVLVREGERKNRGAEGVFCFASLS